MPESTSEEWGWGLMGVRPSIRFKSGQCRLRAFRLEVPEGSFLPCDRLDLGHL